MPAEVKSGYVECAAYSAHRLYPVPVVCSSSSHSSSSKSPDLASPSLMLCRELTGNGSAISSLTAKRTTQLTGAKKRTKGTPRSPLLIGDATRFARAYEKAFKVLSDWRCECVCVCYTYFLNKLFFLVLEIDSFYPIADACEHFIRDGAERIGEDGYG